MKKKSPGTIISSVASISFLSTPHGMISINGARISFVTKAKILNKIRGKL